ncbi:unnamed protein product [Sphagnum jensenii]|uniref:Uncharacterized protein n=1 Tax=Sphagnum jensenii TaxID=128206 RepID=A0ABP1BBV7_9BRYO
MAGTPLSPNEHSFFTTVPMVAPSPPPDKHYIFTRVIGNTTKHVCSTLVCRETIAYIKGWASTDSTLRNHVQTHHMDMVDLMSDYLLFSGLKACIDCTKLYTPCNSDAKRCHDHHHIFKNLQQSNTNLTCLLEVCRDNVDPIQVGAGRLGNHSSEGAQGLAQNLNLPIMEHILTASVPTSDYIPKDAINAIT